MIRKNKLTDVTLPTKAIASAAARVNTPAKFQLALSISSSPLATNARHPKPSAKFPVYGFYFVNAF
jgi:hypothetical protein